MNEYKDVAIGLARSAGDIMLEHFTIGMDVKWKADSNGKVVRSVKDVKKDDEMSVQVLDGKIDAIVN